MKLLIVFSLLFAVGAAHADFPVHFIKATCAPELDYFEISVSSVNNPRRIYGDKGLNKKLAVSLKRNGVLLLLEPGELRCELSGTVISIKNEPYPTSETRLFPGARISLIVDGRVYASAVDLFTQSEGAPYLSKIAFEGAAQYIYYDAGQGDKTNLFNVFQRFPAKSAVTNETLRAYDGNRNVLYPQDDGTITQ